MDRGSKTTGLEIDTNARTETGNVIKNMELRPHSHLERSKLMVYI